ncbi:Phox homologous domain-containing protein [Chlamydoabsidia padenii]|nr:Phox homologous domain-containing protein [Chlamydoabsidia padenii]
MDNQKKLMNLLDQCQDTWVRLHSNNDTNGIRSRKDLRVAIKQLVQLQDDFDDLHTVADVLVWEGKAQTLSEQVTQQVNSIRNVMNFNSVGIDDPPSPINIQTTSTWSTLSPSNMNNNLIPDSVLNQSQSSPSWSSHQLPNLQRTSLDRSEPSEDDSSSIATTDLCLSKSNSDHSITSIISLHDTPSIQVNPTSFDTGQCFIKAPRRSKLSLSLPFKKFKSSYSSPGLANINFYKDSSDDNTTTDSFAADAIVDHPLRIGAGYGSYICYNCTVVSNKGTPITIRKRYSDFVHIRQQLVKLYPNKMISTLPKLPPKKIVKKFDPVFVEQRRRELEYFFRYIVLHPTFGSSTVVKQWIAP